MAKKKDKITYIDDGRTIADMSGVSASGPRLTDKRYGRPRASFKEQWNTYWSAVKMMFGPMLVVICAIVILYMVLWLVFWLA